MADEPESLDEYVFIDHVDPGKSIGDVLHDVFDQNPTTVRFTAQFAGPFIGFVAATIPDLATSHRLAREDFWNAGLRCETVFVIRASALAVPKRGSPDVCALVRVKADDPDAVLDALDGLFRDRFEEERGKAAEERGFNYGGAVVNGTHDLLVDVGSPTFGGTRDLVNEVRRAHPAIRRTATAFAHLPGNARRREL
jgi:hypothetical protein